MDHWQTRTVAEALGINGRPKADGGNNIAYDIRHQESGNPEVQTYKVDGKEYRVRFFTLYLVYRNTEPMQFTQARHSFIVNPTDGGMYPLI
jgi:hypothetical protein